LLTSIETDGQIETSASDDLVVRKNRSITEENKYRRNYVSEDDRRSINSKKSRRSYNVQRRNKKTHHQVAPMVSRLGCYYSGGKRYCWDYED
jgi:hypothetical protein